MTQARNVLAFDVPFANGNPMQIAIGVAVTRAHRNSSTVVGWFGIPSTRMVYVPDAFINGNGRRVSGAPNGPSMKTGTRKSNRVLHREKWQDYFFKFRRECWRS